jgi:uncharacterized protein YggT (Ycf19 family)
MEAALLFLIRTLFDLYLLTYLLRFILQWIRADFYNPFAQFVLRVTNPLVIPARRIIPAAGGIDLATLTVMLLLQLVATYALLLIAGIRPELFDLVSIAALRLVSLVLWLYFAATLLYVILSDCTFASTGATGDSANRRPGPVTPDRTDPAAGVDDRAATARLPAVTTHNAPSANGL